MRPLFISATGTGVGKSFITQRLIRIFAQAGDSVLACKPIETGANPLPEDASAHLALLHSLGLGLDLSLEQICLESFSLPASPLVSAKNERRDLNPSRLLRRIAPLIERGKPLLVEGAGGLLVPILRDYFMIDLARDLEAHVVLVLPGKLGGINEALLSMEALDRRGVAYTPLLNLFPHEVEDFRRISAAFWEQHPAKLWRIDEEQALREHLLSAIQPAL